MSDENPIDENIEDFKDERDERPLECTECRKEIAVRYTEIVGGKMTHTIMCADCPQLEQRLHGIPPAAHSIDQGAAAGLCCGACGTTLDAVRMGHSLGCSDCYDVFEDVITQELITAKKLPQRLGTVRRGSPIYIGRQPGEVKELNSSLQLSALNEALNDTLRREDYEQAAWLRDQINEITEAQDGEEKK